MRERRLTTTKTEHRPFTQALVTDPACRAQGIDPPSIVYSAFFMVREIARKRWCPEMTRRVAVTTVAV